MPYVNVLMPKNLRDNQQSHTQLQLQTLLIIYHYYHFISLGYILQVFLNELDRVLRVRILSPHTEISSSTTDQNYCEIGVLPLLNHFFTNIMKTTPHNFFALCRRCLCQSNAHRGRSTRSGQSSRDDDAEESLESEDFCETVEFSSLDIDPEELNIRDPAQKQRMRSIQTEIYMLNESGGEVPSRLSSKQWSDLLIIESAGMRAVYLQRLWHNEQRRSSLSEVQTIRWKKYLEEKDENLESGPYVEKGDKKWVQYGLNFNTLFRGTYGSKMNQFYYYRLFKAMVFGPDIVVDCGYDNEMDSRNLHRCARDIHRLWVANKVHANPFNIRFCNLSENNLLFSRIRNHFPDFDEPDQPFNFTSLSYLDLYDKKRLVYLTPYCTQTLHSYDPHNVYIIGALTNCKMKGQLSFAKAKREGIRTARFPFYRSLIDWNFGLKSVRTSTALAIMNDLKEQRDWRTIFRSNLHVVRSPQEKMKKQNEEKYDRLLDMKPSEFV